MRTVCVLAISYWYLHNQACISLRAFVNNHTNGACESDADYTIKYDCSLSLSYRFVDRGHNGVRSCIDCLHTDVSLRFIWQPILEKKKIPKGHSEVFMPCSNLWQVMPRLRIGIGRPSGNTPVDKHVLGRFSKEEQNILSPVIDQSVEVLLAQITEQQLQLIPAGGRRATQKRKERPPSSAVQEPEEKPHRTDLKCQ